MSANPTSATTAAPRSVAVTGARGRVGTALCAPLAERGHDIRPLNRVDLPTGEAASAWFTRNFEGRHAVIHLAWQYATDPRTAPGSYAKNLELNRTVLRAAAEAQVPRVIVASSVHADYFFDHPTRPEPNAPLIRPEREPRGNGPYGCAKVLAEQDAHAIALATGLDIVCLRLGAVTPDNQPHPTDPWEQRVFLHHDDLLALIEAILQSPRVPERCVTIYAVSEHPQRVHDTANPFGWSPQPQTHP